MAKPSVLRVVHTVFALLFLLGAAVQLNDPDPWSWVAIYTAAGLCCALWRRVDGLWLAALGVAAAAFGWGGWIAWTMPRWVAPWEMVESMKAYGGAVELAREVWGLAILGTYLLFVAKTDRSAGRSASR
mgnify:CR=1 FL=1